MKRHEISVEVLGPWSLPTSRAFWEAFAPAALPAQHDQQQLVAVFRVEADWSRAEATVTQCATTARVAVTGEGDLDAAAAQVCRFLSLDVDARGWPRVADHDPVIADAQAQLPGLRHAGSTPRTKQRPGRCCPSASASSRRPGCARTCCAATARPAPSPARCSCAPSSWTSPAARASTCTPSPTQPWG